MLTEKENYLLILNGGIPEWVPTYTFGKLPGSDKDTANVRVEPSVINEHRLRGGGRDFWGVEYITSRESGGAIIPKTWDYILDDIRRWRDVIKAPSFEGVDWEAMVKKDLERTRINRQNSALSYRTHIGYFQILASFLGFENCLLALYEEPEEVEALLDYMCGVYEYVTDKCIDLYKPDVLNLTDDTAAWQNPFISLDMYRRFFLPCYDRLAKYGRERGIPITFHNCGKCEIFLEDMLSIGVCAWESAQTCNDLAAIKKKYAGRLTIIGGWDARGRLLADDVTDEEIRRSVYDTFSLLAPGGGYVWCGAFWGTEPDDPIIARKNRVLNSAVEELSRSFYR